MSDFNAMRKFKKYSFNVSTPAVEVFPLLCPVREHEWVQVWAAKMIYSQSGVAEKGCVFLTDFPQRGGQAIWVVSRHEPENNLIEFVIVYPGFMVDMLEITLKEQDSQTTLTWSRTYTGLSQAGNDYIINKVDGLFEKMMSMVEKSLQHFCRTGEMLKLD
jgi:hypothetical protein